MNAIENLTDDERWVLGKYRRAKHNGFATIKIEVHNGAAEFITVEEKFKPEAADVRKIREA